MSALTQYLKLHRELLDLRGSADEVEADRPKEDDLLDALDDLWWQMRTEQDRLVANLVRHGKWIRMGADLICPHCGDRRERRICPLRCHECMRDVIPEEV